MFRSLRSRVALAAWIATAVVILVGGVVLLFLVEQAERDALDSRLAEQADVLETALVSSAETGIEFDPGEFNSLRPDVGTVIRAYRDGEVVIQAGRRGTNFPVTTNDGFADVVAGDRTWRMLSTQVVDDPARSPVFTQVAVPTRATDEVIADFRLRVIVVALLSAGISGLAGWVLCGFALRPLSRLRNTAELVSSSQDLTTRVPTGGAPQEVDDLSTSLNVMLARLEEASASTASALTSSREFAGNAAHEMRTPLTSMGANIEVLRKNSDLPSEQMQSILASVAQEQQRLSQVINALYALAKGEVVANTQMELIDLADLVGVELEASKLRWPAVQFHYEVPSGQADVCAWNDGMKLLFGNLISNAARYGNGAVEVVVEPEVDRVVVCVHDNGPGVALKEKDRIFDRFVRSESVTAGGSGLGLALVRQQVRLHKGEVEILRSHLGGACFRVIIPSAVD